MTDSLQGDHGKPIMYASTTDHKGYNKGAVPASTRTPTTASTGPPSPSDSRCTSSPLLWPGRDSSPGSSSWHVPPSSPLLSRDASPSLQSSIQTSTPIPSDSARLVPSCWAPRPESRETSSSSSCSPSKSPPCRPEVPPCCARGLETRKNKRILYLYRPRMTSGRDQNGRDCTGDSDVDAHYGPHVRAGQARPMWSSIARMWRARRSSASELDATDSAARAVLAGWPPRCEAARSP